MDIKDLKIKFKDKNFTPSEYQLAIFDNVVNGIGNMVLKAVAGAGKTSTLVNIINLIDEKKKILFIAFNKDIVNELKNRIDNKTNRSIMTYHSLGFSILREKLNIDLSQVDEFKYRTYIKQHINEYEIKFNEETNSGKINGFINNVIALTDYSRHNLSQSVKEINKIADKYGVILFGNECEIVKKVLKWGSNNLKTIDYTDMIWLPNELNLNTKKYLYDWVMVDESQDTSIAQQELFNKCLKRGSRFILVGDEMQAINQWAGASVDAIEKLCNLPNTKIFTLPITYRCPKSVVKLAQEYVPYIQYKEGAIEGEINYDVSINTPQSNDMILCRTTAPLVRLYMKYLRNGKKCYIKGKDIGGNLISLIEGTNEQLLNKSLALSGVFSNLYERLFFLRKSIMTLNSLDEKDATSTMAVMDLYDSIKAIEIISEGLTTADELIEKIKNIFLDSDGSGVCLSTIHKAKGLEADNIYILCKSLMPSILAKKRWELQAERNLIYVAITRAKKTLNYISEVDFPPGNGYYQPNKTFKELKEIEEKLSKIINIKTPKNKSNNNTSLNDNKPKVINITDIKKEESNKEINVNNSKKSGVKFKKFL